MSHKEESSELNIWVVILIVGGLMIWGASSFLGGEREGVVKYSDCREQINLKPDSFQRYYKKFTCDYTKTDSGKIMSGTCVKIDSAGGLFSDGSECRRAYIYEKKPEVVCSQEFPYLGYDDMCHKNWNYGYIDASGKND